MGFRLGRDEPLAGGALRLLREELATAVAQLRSPGDIEAGVHGARKAIKRARAVLRLVRAGLGPEFAREDAALRGVARLLARHRDAAVAAATFEKLVPEPPPSLVPLRDALDAVRASTRTTAVAATTAAAAELELVSRDAEAWPPLSCDWPILEAGLRDSYRRGRRAMRAALRERSPDAFHAWRKRVKGLWYHTLILQGVWKTVQRAWAGALEELGEILGEEHDLDVLRSAVNELADLDAAARRALLDRAEARRAELFVVARDLGRRLYAEPTRRYVARLRDYWSAWRGDDASCPQAERASDAPAEAQRGRAARRGP